MNLYPHQEYILEKTKRFRKVGYMLDMGLGKTFVGSEKLISFGTSENIVVCQKSKVQDWIDHFIKYYPQHTIIDLTSKKKHKVVNMGDDICIGVVNYELIWRRPEFIPMCNYSLLLDESTMIGNITSKTSTFITKLDPRNVILLSGTPSGGKYEKLYPQLKMLGYPKPRHFFMDRYVVTRELMTNAGFKIKVPTGTYKNIPELKIIARRYNCYFMKTEEVIDLPEQTFIPLTCENTPIYKRFVKDRIVNIDGEDLIGDNAFKKLLGERMLCGVHNSNKIVSFKDILESTNDRLIVFYNFKKELDQLIKAVDDRPMSFVNGEKRDLEAYENEENSITFCQYRAASRGLNLQKANKIVYFSPTLSADEYAQSQKRIHRLGTVQPCFYYKMIVRGSVEEKIYKALDKGIDYDTKLFEFGDE